MKRTEKIKKFGFFNVDKPSGIVSSAVVNKCKWLTATPCGHMGTLDPLASGVLPVGVGNAARLFDYFLEKEKVYIAEFTFGVYSDTLDSTGTLERGGHVPNEREIAEVLPRFFGDILQVPPKYSAKNVNGKRGYELARAGVEFTLAPKKVHIYGMQTLGKAEGKEDTFKLEIRCGGGTYIRSLARDIAAELGTNAVMSALHRTKSGAFTIENAIPFSLLETDPPIEELERYLLPTEKVLPYENLFINGKRGERVCNGMSVPVQETDGVYKLYIEEEFYGVAQVTNGYAKAKTKLC